MMVLQESLRAHDQKPDCFKEAARALRQGCRSVEQDNEEKTKCKSSLFLWCSETWDRFWKKETNTNSIPSFLFIFPFLYVESL
jgi:hypothetical protein